MDKKEIAELIQELYDKWDEKYQLANKKWDELRVKENRTLPEQIVLDSSRINTSYTLGAKTALAELMNEIITK